MQKSYRALILSAFALSAPVLATPEHEGRLRAIIAELIANNDAMTADAQTLRESLREAQAARETAEHLIRAEAARANARIAAGDNAAAKLRAGLQEAQEATEKAEADESWWRVRCLLLALAIAAWVGFKAVRLFGWLPTIGL